MVKRESRDVQHGGARVAAGVSGFLFTSTRRSPSRARHYLYAAHADDAVVVAQRDGQHHRDDLNARRRAALAALLRALLRDKSY